MTVGDFRKALDSYPEDAKIVLSISIPELYINTIANGRVTGDHIDPSQCNLVQILATAPPRQHPIAMAAPHENTEQQGAVQKG